MDNHAVFEGRIDKKGHYSDGIPIYVISLKKESADGFPAVDGTRNDITLVVSGRKFVAGTRSTEKSPDVRICQDMLDADGHSLRLSELLLDNGFCSRDKVRLVANNNVVTLLSRRCG